MKKHLNRHLRLKAIKKALEMYGNGSDKSEIRKELLSMMDDLSNSNAKKHVEDIFSNFLDVPMYFIEFYKKLNSYEKEQFIHLTLLNSNLFYRKLLSTFTSINCEEINWRSLKKQLTNEFPKYSEKTLKSEFSKAVYLLNQLGLLFRGLNGYKIRRWSPLSSLLSFILYLKYSRKKIVEINTILNDEDVTCMLWDISEKTLEELLQNGDGKYFFVEQVGPLDRIILKYSDIKKFVRVFND